MKEKSPEMESDRGQRGKRGVGECVLCFVLRTTSVSPLDRDKDEVLDPEKYWIIFPFGSGACFFHASFLFFYCRSLQVVYGYRIRIAPDSDVLEIENSLINTAPYERLLGVWSITRLDSFSLKRILLSAGNDSPAFRPEVAKHGDAVTLIRRSRNTELQTAIREKTPRDFFELRAWPETAELVAESRNGTRLRIEYQTLRRNRKQEASLHLFLCDRFSEMESHGPTRLLKPGQRISLMERWRLL